MMNLESFLEMGGYGAFVWPAYVLSTVVLAGFLWQSLRELRQREAELRTVEESDEVRSRREARRSARHGKSS